MIVAPLVLLVVVAVLMGFVGCWGYVGLQMLLRSRLIHSLPLFEVRETGLDGDDLVFVADDKQIFAIRRRRQLIPWVERRQVPWGLVDLILVILLALLLTLGMGLAMKAIVMWKLLDPVAPEPNPQATLAQSEMNIAAHTVLEISLIALAALLIVLRTGATWRDYGVSFRHAWQDIRLGAAIFCMFAPFVYAIQAALTFVQPYEHPLIEMLQKSPDLRLFVLLAFSAVILAPLAEEWLFRVLLQGWIEKVFTYNGPVLDLLLGGTRAGNPDISFVGPPNIADVNPSSIAVATAASEMNSGNPYASSALVQDGLVKADIVPTDGAYERPYPEAFLRHWLPIAISSLIFALMHYGQGLAWIPLTFLSLALGYIYQRTHRILPSITVHFCLNGLSMAGLWVQMFELKHLMGK